MNWQHDKAKVSFSSNGLRTPITDNRQLRRLSATCGRLAPECGEYVVLETIETDSCVLARHDTAGAPSAACCRWRGAGKTAWTGDKFGLLVNTDGNRL